MAGADDVAVGLGDEDCCAMVTGVSVAVTVMTGVGVVCAGTLGIAVLVGGGAVGLWAVVLDRSDGVDAVVTVGLDGEGAGAIATGV